MGKSNSKLSLIATLAAGVIVSTCSARAQDGPPTPASSRPAGGAEPSVKELAASLQELLIQELPDPLFEDQKNWGHTASVPNGLKLKGKGLQIHSEVTKEQKNHGTWRKIRVSAIDAPKTLTFDIRDVRKLDQGRTQFNVGIGLDARMDGTQQNWSNGIKLYDGSMRARFRIQLAMVCELTTRIEPKGWLVPDIVLRLRVTEAKADYDHFATEHIGGLGGDAAKVIGEAMQKILRPAIEKKLLPKASNAIIKSADSKEVRISLGSLAK
jgi:hypothetical protein